MRPWIGADLVNNPICPPILARRNRFGAPTAAMIIYGGAHILPVWLVNLSVTSLSGIVGRGPTAFFSPTPSSAPWQAD